MIYYKIHKNIVKAYKMKLPNLKVKNLVYIIKE